MIIEFIRIEWEKQKKGGGGKTTYPMCINIPYIRAIESNAVVVFIVGTKIEIVLLSANANLDSFFTVLYVI